MDPLTQLKREHIARQLQRVKMKAPVGIVCALLAIASVIAGLIVLAYAGQGLGIGVGIAGVTIAILWLFSAQLLAEWDRAIILRLGRFNKIKGPGFFMVLPIIDNVMRVVDTRVRTTAFHSEAMLTQDTVPIGVEAIAFWHIWDAKKAVLELESYYDAIVLAVQTALRDLVGVHSLAEILSEREKINETLQHVLQAKTEAWGISVTSIEIRDISIPENLKDALSKQAQAERERQARAILGQAEVEIAESFVEASKGYRDNPVAFQLRAMNILYEGLRARGSLMLVPSSILDTMNLGSLAAIGSQFKQTQDEAETGKEE